MRRPLPVLWPLLAACLAAGVVACAGDDGGSAADVGYDPPDTVDSGDGGDAPDCADQVCERELAEEAAAMCGVFRPPQVNETTWTEEQLEATWTYDATDHAMPSLRDEPITFALGPADTADVAAFAAWRERAATAFEQVLRLDAAEWTDTPLLVRELAVEQHDGYSMRTIDYLVEPGQRIPAYLLVPDGIVGPAPAIVLWHGHGPNGKEAMIEGGAGVEAFNRYHEGAHRMAQAGYVVLAPDIRSFGATGSPAEHEHFTMQLLLHGRVALGTFVADAMKAIDVLETYAVVDPERIGMGGTSLGGEVTLFTTALDPRVKVAVVNGYLASYRGTTLGLLHCVCQYVPVMGRTLDIADVAALAAPVPLRFVTGEHDGIFPRDEAAEAFDILAPAWGVTGAPDSVDFVVHPGEHEWVHELALEWFDPVLRPLLD